MTALSPRGPETSKALKKVYGDWRAAQTHTAIAKKGEQSVGRELGKAMREYRVARNVSLREMARRCKVSAAYVSDVERGNRQPTGTLLASYLKSALGARP